MRRLSDDQLQLVGNDVECFIDALTTYDPQRLPVEAFPPAERYIAALGYMLRTYLEPAAWVREAAFDLQVHAIHLQADPGVLEQILARMALARSDGGGPLHFRFADHDEADQPNYDPAELVTLGWDDLQRLFERDAAEEQIMEGRLSDIDASFATFVSDWIDLPLRITVQYNFEVHGLRYDRLLARTPEKRPNRETSSEEPGWNRGLRGLLRREERRSAAEGAVRLDRASLYDFLRAQMRQGALVIRDGEMRGRRYPVILFALDGASATGIIHDSGGWRLGAPQVVGPSELARFRAENSQIVLSEDDLP